MDGNANPVEPDLIITLRSLFACVAALSLSQQTNAANPSAVELPMGLGGSVTWTSDYVLRGVSQTFNQPALQADVHIHPADHWLVGAWASTLHTLRGTRSTELDVYLSHKWIMSQDLSLDIAATHYAYLNDPRSASYDYDELALSAYWADTMYARIAWSPNADLYWYPAYAFHNQSTITVEAGYHRPLPHGFHFQIGGGFYVPLAQDTGKYAYGSAGLSRRFGSIRAEVNYFYVQSREHRVFNAGPAGGPWTATVSWGF